MCGNQGASPVSLGKYPVIDVADDQSRLLVTTGEIETLRDAIALVIALRAGDKATARQILLFRGGGDLELVQGFVGIVEALAIGEAARLSMSLDELLRRLALRLADQSDLHLGTSPRSLGLSAGEPWMER